MMQSMRIKLICIVLLCSSFKMFHSTETLLMSHVIFRHGVSNPVYIFPKSEYNNWDGGLGTLQNKGAAQMYNLGKTLKAQYIDKQKFIGPVYNYDEIYARSSSFESSLMSTQAFLAGMFPPDPAHQFDTSLLWQPLPVQTVNSNNDTLRISEMYCPKTHVYLSETLESEDWKKYSKLHEVYENTGSEANIISIWDVYNELSLEKLIGKKLPDWLTMDEYDRLEKITFFMISQTCGSQIEKFQRVNVGHLLYSITQHMVRFLPDDAKKDIPKYLLESDESDDKHDTRKLYIYSTEDLVIYALLSALGVPASNILPFAASLTLELQEVEQNNAKSLVLKVFYSEDTKTFKQLPLPTCNEGKDCTLVEFIKVFGKLFEPNVNKMCGIEDNFVTPKDGYGTSWTKGQFIAYAIAACYGAFSTIIFLGVIIYLVIRTRRF